MFSLASIAAWLICLSVDSLFYSSWFHPSLDVLRAVSLPTWLRETATLGQQGTTHNEEAMVLSLSLSMLVSLVRTMRQ